MAKRRQVSIISTYRPGEAADNRPELGAALGLPRRRSAAAAALRRSARQAQ